MKDNEEIVFGLIFALAIVIGIGWKFHLMESTKNEAITTTPTEAAVVEKTNAVAKSATEKDLNRFGLSMSNSVRVTVKSR